MPGGHIQLAAQGAQDFYLIGNPTITYFVSVYKRHTNFAIESVQQLFEGDADFGKKIKCHIQPIASLINAIFLDIKLPSLAPNQELDYDEPGSIQYSWVNSIGHVIIDNYRIIIGGNTIDRQFGQWLEIWSELTVPLSKNVGYYEMVGKHNVYDSTTQPGPLHLIIPLQFWFCRCIGLSLPLVALQQHKVEIEMSFRKFDDLWISSSQTNTEIKPSDLKISEASLYVDYIYLDNKEKRWFAKNSHYYLIDQLQIMSTSLNSNRPNNIIELNFNNPIKELIWVVQNSDVLTPGIHSGNEWFNFSDRSHTATTGPGGGTAPTDCMIDAVLKFEGNERFSRRSAKYFRLVQPYQKHTKTPANFIYVYSFALEPESWKPTGACNFSKIDNVTLNINLISGLDSPVLTIYGVNFNILQISNGMGGVVYSD
jgi:hypothetical protein